MSIRSIIRDLFPYRFMIERYKGQYAAMDNYIMPKDTNGVDLKKDTPSKFKNIISIQGFGYSGSGTIVDYLREYSNCRVLGYVSKEGSKASRKEALSEIDILRLAGGLFEVEKYLDSKNVFINDALLHRMRRNFTSSSLFRTIPEIQPYFVSFFNSMVEYSMDNMSQTYYNSFLTYPCENRSIYFLKQMPLGVYREMSRNFLNNVLNHFHDDNTDYLVVDQMFSDFEFDMVKNQEYLPGLKIVFVIRDPRDLYAWANYNKVEWIPQDLDGFLRWYKIMLEPLDLQTPNALVLRYEEICLDFDKQEKRIIDYLNLDAQKHILPRSSFDPDTSKRFVSIWKHSFMPKDHFDIIKKDLGIYCCEMVD